MVLVDDDEPHNAASIAAEDYVNTTEFFLVSDADCCDAKVFWK